VHNAHIFNFPVQAIVMEKCDNTLDSLMYGRNEMTEPEWAATLMQIIMTLVAYQHMFSFTHNDLHTNNVMFVKTEKKFLHYHYNGVYYRVPTHGRIMKIIDFGRAIYKFRGQTMVSDSFDLSGDAATQYNCEPYLNPKKPRLDPNPSFDLCRLACSLFDYFVEDIRDAEEYAETLKESRVARMVVEWLNDDKGRNVLYKKNGDERYPEFKLYKMIARTVHGAVPHEQLQKPMFAHYAIPRKQINGKPHIMDIDALPCYKDALTQAQSQPS
jgi:serine/threonine protein kinase